MILGKESMHLQCLRISSGRLIGYLPAGFVSEISSSGKSTKSLLAFLDDGCVTEAWRPAMEVRPIYVRNITFTCLRRAHVFQCLVAP
jgi:hypothetical protein